MLLPWPVCRPRRSLRATERLSCSRRPTPVRGGLAVEREYLQTIAPDTVACRLAPFSPSLTLVAVALLETSPKVAGERKGDVEIIIADTVTGRPIARRVEKGMAFSDAVQFRSGSLTFDTARYDIKAGQPTFGLRTSQSGSSPVYPFGEQALWLYVFDNGRIERVLDGLIVERLNAETSNDCDGTTTVVKRKVSVDAKEAGGYRDLLVDQTTTSGTSKKSGDDCEWTEKTGPVEHIVLHFGGGHYRRPLGAHPSPSIDGEPDLFSDIFEDGSRH